MARTDGATSSRTPAVGHQQAWQSMRVMRRFTSADLLVTCPGIGESGLHKYLRALRLAGFLRLARPRVSGRAGSRDLWELVLDTGPLCPIKRWHGGMYDRNTEQAHGLDGGSAGGVCRPADAQDGKASGGLAHHAEPRPEGEVHG